MTVKDKTHVRCTRKGCRRRRVLNHHPEWYLREPRCRFCKGRLAYCNYMNHRPRESCNCDGYYFPHRPGSKGCLWRVIEGRQERRQPGDPDWYDPQMERG